jgi:hypothetical protein
MRLVYDVLYAIEAVFAKTTVRKAPSFLTVVFARLMWTLSSETCTTSILLMWTSYQSVHISSELILWSERYCMSHSGQHLISIEKR